MIVPFFKKVLAGGRIFLPAVTTGLAVLAGAVPSPLPHLATVVPSLGLSAVYYWAIYRPDLLRPWMVFVLGLLSDALNFLPFGLSAFVFVGAYGVAFAYRRFFVKQEFLMLWSGFAFVAGLGFFVQWAVVSFESGALLSAMPVFLQFLMTIVFFPLLAWILIRLQRAYLSQN